MTLAPGTRLGVYEITSQLGEGGMGQVFRATDTKLKRQVAIKILPPAVAGDHDRLARFQREAEVLASLNHPNIAGIHGVEERDGITALVMELVDGPTLEELIARPSLDLSPSTFARSPAHGSLDTGQTLRTKDQGPRPRAGLPVNEALKIARQIGEALEAAHEQGIVHRDLKPANIKVRDDGTVKVLDFGLAKIVDAGASQSMPNLTASPTLTSPGTMAGTILGTAAYMSPEQARGRFVDKRADIWAFGAIIFEMLTGQRAFPGDTVSDVIVSVLSRELPWTALPPDTPARLKDLLRRCLKRDAAERLRDIGDARIEIGEIIATPSSQLAGEVPATVSVAPPRRSRALAAVIGTIALVAGVGIGFGGARLTTAPPAPRPSWSGTQLPGPAVAVSPRLSPDGKTLAFAAFVSGLTQVAVMNPDSGNWRVLTEDRTRGYISQFSWARDGSRIYYSRYTDVPVGIYTIPALGGEERLVLENAAGAQQLADGSLVVMRINAHRRQQLYQYWPADGRTTELPAIVRNPEVPAFRLMADGHTIVFRGGTPDLPESDPLLHTYLLDLSSMKTTSLPDYASFAESEGDANVLGTAPDNRIGIVASHEDLTALMLVDPRTGVRETVLDLPQDISDFAFGRDGSVYLDQQQRRFEVWRFNTDGSHLERALGLPNFRRISYGTLSSSLHLADGRTLMATSLRYPRIMVVSAGKDLLPFIDSPEPTGVPMCLISDDRVALFVGTGKARQIAIASIRDGRILKRVPNVPASTTAIAASRDGRTLYYVDGGTIWNVPIDGGEPRKIHAGDAVAVTRDGKQLIIQLIESGGVRWARTDADGGNEQAIAVKGDVHFTFHPLAPDAIGPDGRILLPITVNDSYFWQPAVFDPATGMVQRIPVPFQADAPDPVWTKDGGVIVGTYPLESVLWRFKPNPNPH